MDDRNGEPVRRYTRTVSATAAIAVRAFVDARARSYHEPWHHLVRGRAARLDLSPLVAIEPSRGYVPDFLIAPPRAGSPRLRDQLAAIRLTPPEQVASELERCRET